MTFAEGRPAQGTFPQSSGEFAGQATRGLLLHIVSCPVDLVIPSKLKEFKTIFVFAVAGAVKLWQNLCAMRRTFPELSGRR